MLLLWPLLFPLVWGLAPPLDADWGHGWATAGSMLWVDIAARAGPLLPAQLQFLADTYSIISLEKCFNSAQFPGSTEGGARNASAALRRLNPALKVTFYFHRHKFFGGCYDSNAAFNRSAWSAVDDAGIPFAPILYNTSLPQVQAYLASASVLPEDGGSAPDGLPYFDGVFADGTADAASEYGIRAERYAAIAQGSHASLALTQAAVRAAMRPGARLIGNGITMYEGNPPDHGLAVLPWVDGLCHEHFLGFEQLDRATGQTSPAMFAAVVSAIHAATDAGKVVLVKGWPGPACAPIGPLGPSWCGSAASPLLATAAGRAQASALLLQPALAGFLVLANRLTFFSYTWWYTQDGGGVPCAPGSEATCTFPMAGGWFPELGRRLGAPLGGAAVSADGALYTREFEFASVRFNAANVSNSSIQWHSPSPTPSASGTGRLTASASPSAWGTPGAGSGSAAGSPSAGAAASASPLGATPSSIVLATDLAKAAAGPPGAALSSGPAAGIAVAALAVACACAAAARSAFARQERVARVLATPALVAVNPVDWGGSWGGAAAEAASGKTPRRGSVAALRADKPSVL
jgi:hypothetical protein